MNEPPLRRGSNTRTIAYCTSVRADCACRRFRVPEVIKHNHRVSLVSLCRGQKHWPQAKPSALAGLLTGSSGPRRSPMLIRFQVYGFAHSFAISPLYESVRQFMNQSVLLNTIGAVRRAKQLVDLHCTRKWWHHHGADQGAFTSTASFRASPQRTWKHPVCQGVPLAYKGQVCTVHYLMHMHIITGSVIG